MKKLLLILTIFSCATGWAQEFPYGLTTLSQTYFPLSEALTVTPTDDPAWDDPEEGVYNIPIGFSFNMMGQVAEDIVVIDPGCQVVMAVKGPVVNALSPYFADVMNADTSEVVSSILYTTEGPAGSRIFKLEWQHVGFFNEFDATENFGSISNYQVWFYETTNVIEFRYGPNTIDDGTLIHQDAFGTPFIFFLKNFNIGTQMPEFAWSLKGEDASNPSVGPIDIFAKPSMDQLLIEEPSEGIVYHFEPLEIIGVSEQSMDKSLRVYPTVVTDRMITNYNGSAKLLLTIFDALGNIAMSTTINGGSDMVDLSALGTGAYIVRVNDGTNFFTQRIIRQ